MALIPYVTAGFPSLSKSMEHLSVLAGHGADILEVGYPFSDPIADGSTIQFASETALRNGVTLSDTLAALRDLRVKQPIVLMSYLNPLLAHGADRLFETLPESGVSGLVVPDLPIEEADDWLSRARSAGVNLICLVAPTSPDERIRAIVRQCSGFLYCVSLTGTTGVRASLPPSIGDLLARVRRLTEMPVAVGFGISTPEHIRALRGMADGVVVGSRIIEAIRRGEDLPGLVNTLKEATRSCNHAYLDEKKCS